ncbi:LLM class flavin-dependent oxidoreductase [Novosphingobium sp. AAP93]|uniref:LLM class flavin-dependent oxidoreductase n=1 Tax=Novosphingobium sp. AAP93 TaxID=1523427 RepID=UPI0006B91B74|nr:LLM class flavin-dependent oxidoreductase [Novosphingobium sp. AAP93]KPF84115.1 oxidoreductase [Novosphingobium sp. AAP93]
MPAAKPDAKAVWAELPVLPAGELVPLVQGWEAAGVEGVWAPQIFGAPFTVLAAAAAVTSRIKLGTGIALAFTRSPLETACSAIDLDHISDGRAVLGLGSSAESQIEGSFGMPYGKPLAHMREIVGQVREVIARGHTGELARLEGEYHSLDLSHFRLVRPARRSAIPIYLPAVFEKACEQAGALADGLLGHPLWTTGWLRDRVGQSVQAGLDRAGRSRSAIDINLMMFTVINPDRAEAISDARANIAFYTQSPQYLRYFSEIGFGTEAKAIQAAFAAQDYEAMAKACSDDMVSAITIVGSADEVLAQVAERAALADSITPVVPQFGIAPDKAAHYRQRIAEVFYG